MPFYLAGLIADQPRMSVAELQRWVENAPQVLIGSTVASVAAGSAHAHFLASKWICSDQEKIAAADWATFARWIPITPDRKIDLKDMRCLLIDLKEVIHNYLNEVRYQVNSFVICVGRYVCPLTETAVQVGEAIGPVSVDRGNTACKVRFAPDYNRKVQARGFIGKKRKSAMY